jgi:lysozyme family protein
LAFVLDVEGGFIQPDPNRTDNATNMGITLGILQYWRGSQAVTLNDLQHISVNEATDIYRALFWNAVSGDYLPAGVDLMVFDTAADIGQALAAKQLQATLGGVPSEAGAIGQVTLAMINGQKSVVTIGKLAAIRLRYYQSLPTFDQLGPGWVARVTRCMAVAAVLSDPNLQQQGGGNVILDLLESISAQLQTRAPQRLALAIPVRKPKGSDTMANYELKNDSVDTITIMATDASGATEPLPASDTFSVANSDPSTVNAVIGTDASGNPALVINALKQTSTAPVTLTVSDSAGLHSVDLVVDVVADRAPVNLMLDVADATHAPQPVPPS